MRSQARKLLTSNGPYDNVRDAVAGLSHPIPPLYLTDASKLEIPAAGPAGPDKPGLHTRNSMTRSLRPRRSTIGANGTTISPILSAGPPSWK